jgi:hypothetical protein
VSTRRNEGRQRTLPTRLCARGNRATQGPRRCSYGHVSSASGAGGARLHRRAAGGGILVGAVMGGSRAVTSDDVMLHGTRRRSDGSRRQVDSGVVQAIDVWPARQWEISRR